MYYVIIAEYHISGILDVVELITVWYKKNFTYNVVVSTENPNMKLYSTYLKDFDKFDENSLIAKKSFGIVLKFNTIYSTMSTYLSTMMAEVRFISKNLPKLEFFLGGKRIHGTIP